MKIHSRLRSRFLAGTAACAVVLGTVTIAAPSTADQSSAAAAAEWLEGDLSAEHVYDNPLNPGNPDFGLTIDAALAMYATGRGDLAEPIVDALDETAMNYWGPDLSEFGVPYYRDGGAAAKTLVLAEAGGRFSELFQGYLFSGTLLVNELKDGLIAKQFWVDQGISVHPGMVHDAIADENWNFTYTAENAFGQSLAIIAMAGTNALGDLWDESTSFGTAMTDALLRMQCSEGYFLIFPDHLGRTCDEVKAADPTAVAPDGDATAMALSALRSAQQSGVDDLQDGIDRTVAWILGAQQSDGGWGGGVGTEATNTNSTGLLVQALVDVADGAPTAEESAAIAAGRAFILASQVSQARDGNSSLAREVGAIAYNPDEYVQAKMGGTLGGRDRWIRATGQATLGLVDASFHQLVTETVPEPVDPGPGPGTPPPGGGQPATPAPSDKVGAPAPPRGSAGSAVVPAATVPSASLATPAERLGAYLAGMLVDGDHLELTVEEQMYVDYDTTADLTLGLFTLGTQPEARDRSAAFLLHPSSIDAYTRGLPYEPGEAAYAEPLAKLILIGKLLTGAYGPDEARDALVADMTSRLSALVDNGAVVDVGEQGDVSTSSRRQAWVALALGAGGDTETAAAVTQVLADAACDDGSLPETVTGPRCATKDKTGAATSTAAAATALAVIELPEVLTHGVTDAEGSPVEVVDDATFLQPVDEPAGDADAAIAVLTKALNQSGVVVDGDRVDRMATAQVASGLTALGVATPATASTFATVQLPTGGIAADDQGVVGDVKTSIAAAPVLAGSSWVQLPASPIRTATADVVTVTEAARAEATAAQASGHQIWITALAAVLALVVGLGAGVVGTSSLARRAGTTESGTS